MKTILLLGLLVLLHNQVLCKPIEDEDDDTYDYNLQKDDITDDYDDDSGTDQDEEDEEDDVPKFITKPEHFSVREHEDVILPCNISGNTATYTMMWKKNDEIIFQERHIFTTFDPAKFTLVNGTSLSIKNVEASDAGDYSCLVLISADKKEGVKHTLKVLSGVKITGLMSDKSALVYKTGDQLELTCTVESDTDAKITWSRRGSRLGTGPKLIIENIKHEDSGDYQCMADNGIGIDHRSINIKVMHKPVVSLEKFTTNFNGDEYDVELRCTVRSNPAAIVIWRKDGEVLKNHIRKKNNVHILHLQKVDAKQFGKYSCKADNQVGFNEQHVLVTNAPSKALYKGAQELPGKEFNLTWSVESLYPITEYLLEYKRINAEKWIEEKPEVTNSESGNLYMISYILKNLNTAKYDVRVRSRNQWGWSEYSEVTINEQKAHREHKLLQKNHENKQTSNNEEDNNIALETRLGGTDTSSSVHLPPVTSLLCLLVVLPFFNRH